MKSKILFFVALIIILQINIGSASATFEDGFYTEEKTLIFPVSIEQGDIVEIDYHTLSSYAGGILQIHSSNGENLYSSGRLAGKVNHTLKFTFPQDYEGFLVLTGGDQSIHNRIYEVRVNDKTVFDGRNFVKDSISVNPNFLRVTNVKYNRVTLNFDSSHVPEGYTVKEIVITKPGGEVVVSNIVDSVNILNLTKNTTYQIEVRVLFTNGDVSENLNVEFTTNDIDLQNFFVVKSAATFAEVTFNQNNLPGSAKKFRIYNENNELIKEIESNKYTINNLKENTAYSYFVDVVFDENNISEKYELNFTTTELNKEVMNLKADANYDLVELNWNMPTYETLEKARIYRKTKIGLAARTMAFFSRSNESEFVPLFETNGTQFKDLTVSPDTNYTYKVTTVDVNNNESIGTELSVKTKKVIVEGSETTTDNDNFTISWEKPTTGQMKILVGGKEYTIVPAANGKVTIPKTDLEYTLLGDPDVKLQHITDDGKEGIISTPGGGAAGGGLGGIVGGETAANVLNAPNLLKAAVSLLGVVGAFVLLGLAFRVVPRIMKTIATALAARKENEIKVGRRS